MQSEDIEFCNRNTEIGTKETGMEMSVCKSTRRSIRARLRRMAGIGKEDHESQITAPSSEAEDGVVRHIPQACTLVRPLHRKLTSRRLHPSRMMITRLQRATHTILLPGSPIRKQTIDVFFKHILK